MINLVKNSQSSSKKMLLVFLVILIVSAFSFGCSKSTSSNNNNNGPSGINPEDYSYYMGVLDNSEQVKGSYSIMFFSEKVIIDTVQLKINNEEVPLVDLFNVWANMDYSLTAGETYSFEVTINGSKDIETFEMKIPGPITVGWPETIDFSVDNTITWTLPSDPMMQTFLGESVDYASGDTVDKEVDLDVKSRSYVMKANWLPSDTVDNTLTLEADNYHSGPKLFSMAITADQLGYRDKKDRKELLNDAKNHILELSKKLK